MASDGYLEDDDLDHDGSKQVGLVTVLSRRFVTKFPSVIIL